MEWRRSDLGLKNESWIVGPGPSDEICAWFYMKIKQYGLLEKVWYQGVPTIREFLEWYSPRTGERGDRCSGSIVLGAWWRPNPDAEYEFKGMGFVNAQDNSAGLIKCEVGFCFLPELSPFVQSSLIKAMVTLIFTVSNMDTILGTTPERNPAAVALVKRAGLRVFGPVPKYASWHGEPCGVYISQTDRDHWFNQHPLPEPL